MTIKYKHCRRNADLCIWPMDVLGQNLGCDWQRLTRTRAQTTTYVLLRKALMEDGNDTLTQPRKSWWATILEQKRNMNIHTEHRWPDIWGQHCDWNWPLTCSLHQCGGDGGRWEGKEGGERLSPASRGPPSATASGTWPCWFRGCCGGSLSRPDRWRPPGSRSPTLGLQREGATAEYGLLG